MIPKKISVGEHITLRVSQTEKFKAGTLSLSVVLPIRRETAYLTSLLFSVLLRGTQSYPTISDLNRRLDYLFGTELSVRNLYRGDCRIIGLSASILEDAYIQGDATGASLAEDVLEVMREILFCPVLDEAGLLDARYVESEKQLQCDTIRARKNQPASYAAERATSMMYEGEPAGVPIYGTEEEVMAVTPEVLTAHWRELLQRLHLHFFYVGGMDGEVLADAVRRTFADAVSKCLETERPSPVSAAPAMIRATTRAEETLPIGQSHLVMGLRTDCTVRDADFYACYLLNELLGASPMSKLFVNVRERLGLCYSCSSAYNIYKGTILIRCGLECESRELAEAEILRQLSVLAAGEISDEEWQAAQKSIQNGYRQLEDSPGALENYWFGRALAEVSDSPEECRVHFAAVSREDVVRMAKRLRMDTVFFLRSNGEEVGTDEED